MELLSLRGDRPDASIYEKVIMGATGGPWVHTELRFADGRCFSSELGVGVRFVEYIDTSDPRRWDVLRLPWDETPDILAWCRSQVGKGYDLLGATASAFGLTLNNAGEWFCSELVPAAISRHPAAPKVIPPLMHPTALHRWFEEYLRAGDFDAANQAVAATSHAVTNTPASLRHLASICSAMAEGIEGGGRPGPQSQLLLASHAAEIVCQLQKERALA
jgi:hypothetical protein